MPRTTLTAGAGAAAVVLLLAAMPAAEARPSGADPQQVANRSETRAWARVVTDTPGAAAGRRALAAALRQLPRPMRTWYRLGPLHGDRFTFAAVGEEACLSWAPARFAPRRTGQSPVRYAAGACTRGDHVPSWTPLTDSADAVGGYADAFARSSGVEGVLASVDVRNLSTVAGDLAPRGVRVTGVSDRDGDGLEDDARVAFRANGRVVCAQLPLTVRQRTRLFFTGCRHLPARDLRPLRHARDRLAERPGPA